MHMALVTSQVKKPSKPSKQASSFVLPTNFPQGRKTVLQQEEKSSAERFPTRDPLPPRKWDKVRTAKLLQACTSAYIHLKPQKP